MATQHTQYPDARLSSPIVLDQCDLVTRACGLYSSYSLNPQLKNCRLPKHIYRLKFDATVTKFLSDVPIVTLPIDYLTPLLLRTLSGEGLCPVEPKCSQFLDEIVSYVLQDARFLRYYFRHVGVHDDNVGKNFEPKIKALIYDNEFLQQLFYWYDLAILTRRGRLNRGNNRSTWFANDDLIDILGYGDYIFWKIPLSLLSLNTEGIPHAAKDWYHASIFKEAVQGHTHIVSVSTADVLIMCKDIITCRFNTTLIAALANLEDSICSDYPQPETISNLYKAGDYLISILGSEGYKVIKFLEPLCLAKIQLCSNYTERKGRFLTQMHLAVNHTLEELIEGRGLKSQQDWKMREFHRILVNLKSTPQQLCELFSVQKHWGHPVLHSEKAIQKVKKHATVIKALRPVIIFETYCVFKYSIAKHYFDSQGSWYSVISDKHLTPGLHSYIKRNQFPPLPMIKDLLWEFYHLDHPPLFSTKIISDLSIFIKDRATAVEKTCWDAVFEPNVLGYSPPNKFSTKRVPEQFLEQENFSIDSVLTYAQRLDYLLPQYRNFSFSLKEKELNVGRAFGKLPYPTRNVQTLCEALLADGLAKAFPSNMMVVTEREQKESLLHQASWHHTSDDFGENATVRGSSFVTDLEKYNLAFRYEFTAPFIEYCNRCYGVKNLFNWMHYTIPQCYIHVSDYYNPPHGVSLENREDPPEGPSSYRGHLGGIEGLQQKLWTSISCAQISLVEIKTGFKLRSAVMGDNQCITVLSVFPLETDSNEQEHSSEDNAARVAASLAKVTSACGIFLKPDETFVHSGFIYFGKKQYLNGVQLPQSLKTATRIAPLSDAIFDDLQGTLASIGTAFERSISETRHVYPCRVVAAFHTFFSVRILQYHHLGFNKGTDLGQLSLSKPLDFGTITLALAVPQVLGGLSFLNPEKCFYRNLGDPVTSGLFQLRTYLQMINMDDLFLPLIAKNPGNCSAIDFVLNPSGLNVPGSQDLTSFLRQIVRRTITLSAKNKLINTLFHSSADLEDEMVCKWLLSSTPVMSRFAADIFSRTPSGKRLQILGYLEGTRTLLASKVINNNAETPILDRLRKITLQRWSLWFSYLDHCDQVLADALIKVSCTVDLAQILREYTWAHILEGRQLIGATLPCMLEQFNVFWLKSYEQCPKCAKSRNPKGEPFVSIAIKKQVVSAWPNQSRLNWTIGDGVPYIGSRTEDKIGQPAIKPKCPSAALREAIELTSRLTWVTQGGANSDLLVKPFVEARVNLSVQEILQMTPSHYSGNIVHRYNDQYSPHSFMANRMSNSATRLVVSTNTLGEFSGGGQSARDSNIIFQNVINFSVALFDLRFRNTETSSIQHNRAHLHLSQCCTREVPAQYLTYTSTLSLDLTRYRENELIYDNNPLKGGLNCNLSFDNPLFKGQRLNIIEEDLIRFPHLSGWELAKTIIQSIISDSNNSSTDPISSGETRSFTTHFLTYPKVGLLYSFGAIVSYYLGNTIIRTKKLDLSHFMYYLTTQIHNLPHRSLRILKPTFKHVSVISRLMSIDPHFSIYIGGTAGDRGLSDATRLFLRVAISSFLQFIKKWIVEYKTAIPLWVIYPLEGQNPDPINSFLHLIIALLQNESPQNNIQFQEDRNNQQLSDNLVYMCKSTASNFFHASLAYWRSRHKGRPKNRSTEEQTVKPIPYDNFHSVKCASNPPSIPKSKSGTQGSSAFFEKLEYDKERELPTASTPAEQSKTYIKALSSRIYHGKTPSNAAKDDSTTSKGCDSKEENAVQASHRIVLPFFTLSQNDYRTPSAKKSEYITEITKLIRQLKAIPDTTVYCRFTGVVSSMHYKLDEVLWEFDSFKTAVTLAEGEGSGALLLLQKYKVRTIFFNTLATEHSIEAEIVSGTTTPRMLLPVMAKLHDDQINVILNNSASQVTDITNPAWFTDQKSRIPTQVEIMTMDAETTENINRSKLYEAIQQLIVSHIDTRVLKIVIIKVFLSDIEGLLWLNDHLAPLFGSGYLIKPITSSPKSSEWYLCLSNFLSASRRRPHQGHATCMQVIQTALRLQVQRSSYWLSHLVQYADINLHLSYVNLGFPSLEKVLYHRYNLVDSRKGPLVSILYHLTHLQAEIRELVCDYNQQRQSRTQTYHFIKTTKGRITKLVNDYLKFYLVVQALKHNCLWQEELRTLPDLINVCNRFYHIRDCSCEDRFLIQTLYLTRMQDSEAKLMERLTGFLGLYPNGINA
ncbi:RNA-dependent RNA polymerase [Bundibugyo virus]|uniref:RNA-directed RNA polymerase L n=1 Tax=Bundibugyo virus TaxID=565995 RepID=B8XCN5_9MONO|nr:RNA-dependent RNA polymerase [Bundibugyo ebolavirus]ACI28627.1 polymerase [Bundibugyo ebolavirus]AKB09568.1 RNA-directed RNA polymerase L [Bundibugyo ebolavirus]ALT19775.1 RNA-directed RNA polymerase L [Bundibugyo ebolavirus]AYI50312.1 RNA-dependent RNA polymerase [Bundibugyo ebolavirus]AYI50321.1 RNA-dependent RNA polymerase [Bundibugyo ebolavirus]